MIEKTVERKLAERELNEWVSLAEAAKMLDCTPGALRERVRRGSVPASEMSRRLYLKRSDIYSVLEANRR
jgi:hypothetical protein